MAASIFVAKSANAQARVIRATNASVPAGVQSQVPISIQLDSLGNESATSFSLIFNPTGTINPVVTLGSGAPATSNLGINTDRVARGQMGILVDSTNTYAAGTRDIVTVTFTVPANTPVGIYPVGFGSVPTPQSVSNLAGVLLPTTYFTGAIVVGATASAVNVSGRVVTPDGRGIRNATVVVTDTDGNRRLTTTSSFGYYNFSDIESGKTYAVSVQSKQYRFTPRVVQIVDMLSDFDFVGQP